MTAPLLHKTKEKKNRSRTAGWNVSDSHWSLKPALNSANKQWITKQHLSADDLGDLCPRVLVLFCFILILFYLFSLFVSSAPEVVGLRARCRAERKIKVNKSQSSWTYLHQAYWLPTKHTPLQARFPALPLEDDGKQPMPGKKMHSLSC